MSECILMLANSNYVHKSPNKTFSPIKMSDFYRNKWFLKNKNSQSQEAFETSSTFNCFCPILLHEKRRFLIALQKGKISFCCFQTKKLQFSVSSQGTGIPQPGFFPQEEKRRKSPSFPPTVLSSLLNKNLRQLIEKTPLLASQENQNGDKYFFLKSPKFADLGSCGISKLFTFPGWHLAHLGPPSIITWQILWMWEGKK